MNCQDEKMLDGNKKAIADLISKLKRLPSREDGWIRLTYHTADDRLLLHIDDAFGWVLPSNASRHVGVITLTASADTVGIDDLETSHRIIWNPEADVLVVDVGQNHDHSSFIVMKAFKKLRVEVNKNPLPSRADCNAGPYGRVLRKINWAVSRGLATQKQQTVWESSWLSIKRFARCPSYCLVQLIITSL